MICWNPHDPRAHNPIRFRLFRRVLVGRFSYCEVCVVSELRVFDPDHYANLIKLMLEEVGEILDVKTSDDAERVYARLLGVALQMADAGEIVTLVEPPQPPPSAKVIPFQLSRAA